MEIQQPNSRSRAARIGSALRLLLAISCWIYLGAAVVLWLLLLQADDWWLSTILLFSPRWLFALPLAALLPAAICLRRRLLAVVLAAGLIVVGPVAGFNIPWQRLTSSAPAGKPFRIVTINMHYNRVDPPSLEELIATEKPDVLAIQEWSGARHSSLNSNPEWHVHASPGLFLASRYPIRQAIELGHNSTDEHASVSHYELETPLGLVHVFSLHTASLRDGIADTIHHKSRGQTEVEANSERRREQLEFIALHAAKCRGPVLIVGDFNTPPESSIFEDVWSGYTDAFGAAGWGWGYTFFGGRTMVRIDHVLAGPGWTCTDCRVGPKVGSPHRPVIADLIWSGTMQPAGE
jgi:endonuclease/exonuclease/phosphatase (EEP) superfamily protein YafD